MPTAPSRFRIRMTARPIDEPHRTASPLELLFDLTFVVAVAAVTAEFAHGIADGHPAVVEFLMVFFCIWWAWMNFTWFASSYDTDDVLYRLLTMLQMAGVLVLAAGVPAAIAESDYRAVPFGYLIMRIGLAALWFRAGYEDPQRRRTAFRYGSGILILNACWILTLLLTDMALWLFVVLVVFELAGPLWAERPRATTWHPHHIAERYGLFVIILLGESVLAASRGVQRALAAGDISSSFILVAGAGLVLLFALWWLYFLHPAGHGLSKRRAASYRWGYGHFFLFAALAAVGAGLEVAVEEAAHHSTSTTVGFAVAIPVAVYLLTLWLVHAPIFDPPVTSPALILSSVALVLLLPLVLPPVAVVVAVSGVAVLLVALVMARANQLASSPGVTSPHS
ncbi:low temperature requirement protein A [Kribbella sp. NPDC050820]|uniref:low temperature requirement protein A n=1 Tax=Kribbella sp. NPDC050820 TaxID=3155408 RepID=UPI0033FD93F8